MTSGWIIWNWADIPRLLWQAGGLFLVATFVFDMIHVALHFCLESRWSVLRRVGGLHQSHHDFFDRQLQWHEDAVVPNLLLHVIPEYGTQMAVCAVALAILEPMAVLIVMAVFTVIFVYVILAKGKDRYHLLHPVLPAAHETVLVGPYYHALHHVYPESYLSSYITLLDRLMGTSCQIRGRRVAITGASGSFGSAMAERLRLAGAEVFPLKFGADFTYADYSAADAVLAQADILVLAHGAKGEHAMQANCDSFLALIDRFKSLTRDRQVAVEVWAVGSEIECHPAFGIPELQSYARSKRAYARAAAVFFRDPDLLYRHIVPSAFRSPMGPGLISGQTAAAVAFWFIRHGFRYVPVTYTGIALINFIPYTIRGMLTRPRPSQRIATRLPSDATMAPANLKPRHNPVAS
jgi:hypothetical protein